MSKEEEEINLESSLLGFCTLNNLVCIKEYGILMRNEEEFFRRSKCVVVVSGGGAGHEPGPAAGFLGRGMLSVAVSGNIFTSPSVTSCLAAILVANNPNREILLIINNYTGDRLNFGLALEMAQNIHNYRNVKLLIVDDDCSIDNPRESTGRRGLAGISLVNKIAGAMSEKGFRLNEIYDYCDSLLRNRLIRTIGFSFHHDKSNELTEIEIGYGIHGEPGSIKMEKEKTFKKIVAIMKEKLGLNNVHSDVVLLFNNLGGASEFVFYQFIGEFLKGLAIRVIRVYAGKFLTSLAKEAMSVTVMEVHDGKVLEYLTMDVDVPSGFLFKQPLKVAQPTLKQFAFPTFDQRLVSSPKPRNPPSKATKAILAGVCSAAIENKAFLNEIDGELGDGDTGTTLARGASALLNELKENKINVDDPHEMLLQMSLILMNSMGGTSGAIFSIFLQRASKAFVDSKQHCAANWMKGLSLGIDGIMKHGKSSIGDRTLLDSLHEGYVEGAKIFESEDGDARATLEAFDVGCRSGAETTRTMTPKSGRAAYSQGDNQSNINCIHPDSGAFAIGILSSAIYKAFNEAT